MGYHKMVSEFLVRKLDKHSLFPRSGVRLLQVLEMASKVTFAKLPRVAVQLLAGMWHSSILIIISTFLGLGAETASASAAGMRSSNTEQQHPVTVLQTVWGLPTLFLQQPLHTGTSRNTTNFMILCLLPSVSSFHALVSIFFSSFSESKFSLQRPFICLVSSFKEFFLLIIIQYSFLKIQVHIFYVCKCFACIYDSTSCSSQDCSYGQMGVTVQGLGMEPQTLEEQQVLIIIESSL